MHLQVSMILFNINKSTNIVNDLVQCSYIILSYFNYIIGIDIAIVVKAEQFLNKFKLIEFILILLQIVL